MVEDHGQTETRMAQFASVVLLTCSFTFRPDRIFALHGTVRGRPWTSTTGQAVGYFDLKAPGRLIRRSDSCTGVRVGPLLVPGRSKNARTSAARSFRAAKFANLGEPGGNAVEGVTTRCPAARSSSSRSAKRREARGREDNLMLAGVYRRCC